MVVVLVQQQPGAAGSLILQEGPAVQHCWT